MSDVLVIGSGLIGASIGLALAGLRDVCLSDAEPAAVETAVRVGAGRAWDGSEPAELVVVAVPPGVTATTLAAAMRAGLAKTYTHVASVQSRVQREMETFDLDLTVLVGSHPMAGRELGGASSAVADLFQGRSWALCPHPASSQLAVDAVAALATACGAVPVLLPPREHDEAVALVSHVPHLAAAAVAALLLPPAAAASALSLAGPGLVDVTRVAAGDPSLWQQVLEQNAALVAPLARRLGEDLLATAALLDGLAAAAQGSEASPGGQDERRRAALVEVLERGRSGRALVPVKRGVQDTGFSSVSVVLRDEPGQLVAVLSLAAAEGVNIEDVRVEHAAGRRTGNAVLLVHPHDRDRLIGLLAGFDGRAHEESGGPGPVVD